MAPTFLMRWEKQVKIPVFLSRPVPHLKAQALFVEEFKSELIVRGFEPLTMGPGSSYDYDAPLVGIRRILTHCCELISIAFRRTYAPIATINREADVTGREESQASDVWFTSPYCQIEPAMAFQLGLPILLLREKGVVAEGVLEKGVTGKFLPEFDLEASPPFITGEECRGLLDQWGGHVRSVYNRRGDPPKLFD